MSYQPCLNIIELVMWPPSKEGYVTKFVSVLINNRWIKPDLYFQQYTTGKMKPNYPVPAIRCEVAIDHIGVAVYVDSGNLARCGETIWNTPIYLFN